MRGQLEGKVTLMTGGNSGIGRSAALAFFREGAKVVVSDLNLQGEEETVRIIENCEGKPPSLPADVS